MSKRRIKVPTFGSRKFFETLKFVLRAVLFAFIMVNLGKSWNIMSSVYTWCTKIDFGYVWVINFTAGAVISELISIITFRYRKKYAITIKIAKIFAFIMVVLFVECFYWHFEESWEMFKAPIDTSHIILAVLGLVAATLSFVWHLRGVKYDDEYYKDDSEEAPQDSEKPKKETKKEPEEGSGEESTFDWGSGGFTK